jgi:hypothetical protein
MTTLDQLPQVLQQLFTEDADALAKTTGFIQRRRVWTGASFAQTVVFGWMQQPEASLSQLQATAAACGSGVSIKSVATRLCEVEAAQFMRALLQRALSYQVQGQGEDPRPEIPFSHIVLLDSSQITLPMGLYNEWVGSGNQNSRRSAVKLHVHYEWKQGLFDFSLHHAKVNDRSLPHIALPPDSLIIHDSGFLSVARARHYDQQQVFWLSRLTAQLGIVSPEGRHCSLAAWLAQFPDTALLDQVVALTQNRYPVRLVATRLPPEAVQARQARVRDQQRRRYSREPSADQLSLCEWCVLVTSVPPSLCSAAQLLALYRLRWQIELLFKLWKDEGCLDVWHTANPRRILTELYAKLLMLLVQHWLLVQTCWHLDDRSIVKAARVLRAHVSRFIPLLHDPKAMRTLLDQLRSILSLCRASKRPKAPTFFLLRLAFP